MMNEKLIESMNYYGLSIENDFNRKAFYTRGEIDESKIAFAMYIKENAILTSIIKDIEAGASITNKYILCDRNETQLYIDELKNISLSITEADKRQIACVMPFIHTFNVNVKINDTTGFDKDIKQRLSVLSAKFLLCVCDYNNAKAGEEAEIVSKARKIANNFAFEVLGAKFELSAQDVKSVIIDLSNLFIGFTGNVHNREMAMKSATVSKCNNRLLQAIGNKLNGKTISVINNTKAEDAIKKAEEKEAIKKALEEKAKAKAKADAEKAEARRKAEEEKARKIAEAEANKLAKAKASAEEAQKRAEAIEVNQKFNEWLKEQGFASAKAQSKVAKTYTHDCKVAILKAE